MADDVTYYAQLETGARFLAAGAATDAEKHLHLRMADRYAGLKAEARGDEGR